ncbi:MULTISPECIES: bacillithiol biosynthesis deacetylase BshB2 [unclassified Exiguobacterium]|uniref:bacillithiol biosynthesis deacetylase BshB2 n=1 Tax=unclassified Exiguobacterium TaxID=2644629 RepID=UPI001BE52A4D|nr:MULTISPECIES: bacillithiol biosynthesis deacetylase BshB2 [unclassified Exiguobacterium]
MNGPLLVIFPHPDDEAFSSAGTIIQHRQQGLPVTYVCLTLGEMGRNMGSPIFTTREELPKIRKRELEDACRMMGIEDLRMWGLRDKTVEFEDEAELADRFRALIDEVKPETVISFYPGYAVHPDHEATARAVVRALQEMGEARPEFLGVAFDRRTEDELGQPHVIVDVTDESEQKKDALFAHRSQTEGLLRAIDNAENAHVMELLQRERFYHYPFS